MDWNEDFLAVEVERELAKSNQDQLGTSVVPETKGCGCTSIIVTLLVGVVGWRLLLEIIGIISKL